MLLVGDKGGGKTKIYKPTSKLAELASTFQSVKEAKKQEDFLDDSYRPVSIQVYTSLHRREFMPSQITEKVDLFLRANYCYSSS